MTSGLLGSKPENLLASFWYMPLFYGHILFGGVALMVGWSQFSTKLRAKRIQLHRNLGKIYAIMVTISGISSLIIAFFATGGIIAQLGFTVLGVLWLATTYKAIISIKRKKVIQHQFWMIRSYALCFAAVTLRLWLPLLIGGLGLEFIEAYKIVAWLCFVPNMIVAELIIWWLQQPKALSID
ncbi:MAG: DUF2306 domain-containing protein [Saprospiraceae bacterium]|nr:DUF2306 domain-containing protein [Saprospiraceae bacterium]